VSGDISEMLYQILNVDRQVLTRFSDQFFGFNANVKSATQANILQQNGSLAMEHKRVIFQQSLGECLEYALNLFFLTHNDYVIIPNEDPNEEKPFEIVDVRRAKMQPTITPVTNEQMVREFKEQTERGVAPEDVVYSSYNFVVDDLDPLDVPVGKWRLVIKIGKGLSKNTEYVAQKMDQLFQYGIVMPQELREYYLREGLPLADIDLKFNSYAEIQADKLAQQEAARAQVAQAYGADTTGENPYSESESDSLPASLDQGVSGDQGMSPAELASGIGMDTRDMQSAEGGAEGGAMNLQSALMGGV
jgi:hypothetical protein